MAAGYNVEKVTSKKKLDGNGKPVVTFRARVRHKNQSIRKTFFKKVEADIWARNEVAKIDRGESSDSGEANHMTFSEAMDIYLEKEVPAKRPKGLEDATNRVAELKRHKFSKKPMAKITTDDIYEFFDAKKADSGGSDSNLRNYCNLGSMVFKYAKRRLKMKNLGNPFLDVERPSPPKARNRRLGSHGAGKRYPKERETILEEIKKHNSVWFAPLIEFQLWQGMRLSETLKISRDDLDLENHAFYLGENKTDFERDVPLVPEAQAILEAFKDDWGEDRIFDTGTGNMKHATNRATNAWKAFADRLVKEKKIGANLTLHDMRHEAVSYLFERVTDEGTPLLGIPQISLITGHKSWETLKKYTQLKADSVVKLMW